MLAPRSRTWESFARGVDPLQLYVSIAALSYFYLGNNHTLSAVFGRDLATPAHAARLAHMTDVILGYLRRRTEACRVDECGPRPINN